MLTVNFGKEIITAPKLFEGKQFVPIMDSECDIQSLIHRLEEIADKYEVISVFLAGDNIVGSCADIGDYTCLCAEIKPS